MFISTTKILSVALAITSYVSAAPVDLVERASNTIIGYRTVPKERGEAYNKAGTVVWYPASGVQLGDVVYLSPGAGEWAGGATSMYCVIHADTTKWAAAKKAWIPETANGETLWYKPTNIDKYLKDTLHKAPDETLRLSKISGKEDLQLGIPKKMLGKTGDLGLTASCVDKVADLGTHTIDYRTLANTVGTAQ
ncbi:hypothetical protein BO71DRAFT_131630 [Aspergillus ellipticus CBS 707.79]|uniref:Uncharacterized protein n=1 Tax=Aspergillus ellipticus CBS 707.79 TaxID=1448320 RepID=A0A319CV27_9EURO|nr:hypothetical protein BO71DRAFT_131630 [Aspergillus ellipticus CBS 707.79]